jgi:hypothetical protein
VSIIDFREVSLPISRYADPSVPSGGLNTSMLALITDVIRDGKPVVGYGFASIGRFAQGGLIRERFAPRLLPRARPISRMKPEPTSTRSVCTRQSARLRHLVAVRQPRLVVRRRSAITQKIRAL